MRNTIEALNWRYATKEFDPTLKLTNAQVSLLKEALRLTPSSFGLQPWKFILIEDTATREQLVEVSWKQKQVIDASHVFVLCRKTTMTVADIDRFIADTASSRGMAAEALAGYRGMMVGFLENMPPAAIETWMTNQVYIALGNLMTTCAVESIDACPMEGFDRNAYSGILGLDALGLVPVVACPVGFRKPSDKYAAAPKVRFSEAEVHLTLP